mmetsp:Transcript_863/g.3370  ORF Transcript_863/g.3370 Transcript_863/m.3370 type:complete len:283 (-) Transcript_863:203-1051(-)
MCWRWTTPAARRRRARRLTRSTMPSRMPGRRVCGRWPRSRISRPTCAMRSCRRPPSARSIGLCSSRAEPSAVHALSGAPSPAQRGVRRWRAAFASCRDGWSSCASARGRRSRKTPGVWCSSSRGVSTRTSATTMPTALGQCSSTNSWTGSCRAGRRPAALGGAAKAVTQAGGAASRRSGQAVAPGACRPSAARRVGRQRRWRTQARPVRLARTTWSTCRRAACSAAMSRTSLTATRATARMTTYWVGTREAAIAETGACHLLRSAGAAAEMVATGHACMGAR